MPHPADKSEAETTLPDPELNPLLNPLLGAHMGRWAEVYFTSPPDKRAEAVSELLRELEKEGPSEPFERQISDSSPQSDNTRKEIEVRPAPQPFLSPVADGYTCRACGHDNRTEQKFCGMCGASLNQSHEVEQPQSAEAASDSPYLWSEAEPHNDGSNEFLHKDAPWPVREADLPHFASETEPGSYRYRLYIGAAVAILLGALVYMGWRGTGASSNGSTESAAARTMPAAPPEAATPAAPTSAASQPNATNPASTEHKTPAPPVQGQSQAEPKAAPDQPTEAAPTVQPTSIPADSSAIASQTGAEELALGERYLNGNRNTARNSAQAAQWLWKSVAKGNVAATMALSDLYLRGDGVPKSCDQARLLLNAAARKGGTAAAERLRNLQAFGCQ